MVLQVKSILVLGILGIPQILQESLKSGSLGILLGKFSLYEMIIATLFALYGNFYSSSILKHFTKLNVLITQMVNTNSKLNNLAGRR